MASASSQSAVHSERSVYKTSPLGIKLVMLTEHSLTICFHWGLPNFQTPNGTQVPNRVRTPLSSLNQSRRSSVSVIRGRHHGSIPFRSPSRRKHHLVVQIGPI